MGPDVRGGSEEASACPTTPSACPRRPGEKRRDRVMAPGGAVLRNAMRLLGTEEGLPGGGNGGKRGSRDLGKDVLAWAAPGPRRAGGTSRAGLGGGGRAGPGTGSFKPQG